jgi:hypothetical protein
MPKVNKKALQEYVESHGGQLVKLKNGNYNIRHGQRSVNIGRPDGSNKWNTAQLERAWGDATGIPKPGLNEL